MREYVDHNENRMMLWQTRTGWLGLMISSWALMRSDHFMVTFDEEFSFDTLDTSRILMLAVWIWSAAAVIQYSLAELFGSHSNVDHDDAEKAQKGPSEMVKYISSIASLWSVYYSARCGYHRFQLFMQQDAWPESFGLICGLVSVAIAQVFLFLYQFLRRESFDSNKLRIQLKEWTYPRTFFADVKHHLSNPGAFILMLPYLCLTWMFGLMPDTYYVYETPVNWYNVLLQLLVVDFFTYTFHVAEHAFPSVYKMGHKPHHKFVNPQLFNAFDGSLVDTTLLILFPLYTTANLLHVSNWDYIAFGTVYSTHFMLIHSEFAHVFDPLLKHFMVNVSEDHHVHHAIFNSNFSHFFTFYDRIAGTYRDGSSCKGFRSVKAKEA